eukprot:TRINITY_DN2625_c1_g1_i4.p1 TRINITY_DN2625_c1_g1~~TRINITY_DN2625_c1_g1_i4.p1  ORF type:complete len:119 (+),score=34.91 TRINITY_DN2625_c1_g1_i4:21-377(+)
MLGRVVLRKNRSRFTRSRCAAQSLFYTPQPYIHALQNMVRTYTPNNIEQPTSNSKPKQPIQLDSEDLLNNINDLEQGEEEEDLEFEHVNQDTGEIGGPKGPEPTRYGDFMFKGRTSDF